MGERGTKPAPAAIKAVRGDRPSRMPKNDPKPKPSLKPPAPPNTLPLEAQKVWRRLAPDLWEKGVLTPWDEDSFGAYCVAVVQHRRAVAIVEEEGIAIEGDRGTVKHPMLQVIRDQGTLMVRLAGEFGLTPSSRGNIEIGHEETDDARRLLS